MRARDARAITFAMTTIPGLAIGTMFATHSLLISAATSAAYGAFLLSRPRMLRVYRRLRGEADWSGYFDNDGTRMTPRPDPGAPGPTPHPAKRP